MLCDNHAEYDRNTRGRPPRRGRVASGPCLVRTAGRKMVVQYKSKQLSLQPLESPPGRPDLPASSRRPNRRAGGGRVLRGGDAELEAWCALGTSATRRTRPSTAPRPSRSNACAIRRCWPNASSTRSIRITVWWPANWSTAGEVALRELRQAEDLLARHRGARATGDAGSGRRPGEFSGASARGCQPLAAPRHDAGAQEVVAPQSDRQSRSAAAGRRPGSAFDRLARRGEISDLEVEAAVYTHQALTRGAEMEARL